MASRGASGSGSPATPTGSAYQVNVNRQKTRKWVEAKVQNYDGDDWGAPESDEEPDSPPPGPPQVMTARPAVDRRLPSESRVPGSGRASPVVGPPNSTRTWESSSRVPSLSTSDSRRRPVSDNTDPIKTDPALPAQELDSTPVVGTEGGISEQQQDEVRASRRTSKSPQLPDVARMSGFGPDLFFSNSGAQDKPASQPTVQEESPQQSPQPSSALPATGQDTTESRGQLTPAADPRNLPALRTPSPHEPRTVPPPVEEPKNESPAPDSWQAPNPDVTPTEPLQPKKPERSPSDYEPGPLQRQPTLETATSSPVKESDVLSQEIMRSLSPGGGLTPIDTSVGAKAPQGPSPATRRESSYTLSGYDDYWADSGESPRLQKRPTGDLDNVPEDAPPSSTGPSNGPSAVPAIVESTVVPKSSGQEPIRRKFSWEDLGDDTQSAKSPARSATASPAVTAAQPNDALPAEQPALMSPSINIIPENDSLVGQQVDQRDFSPQPLAIQEPTPEPASPLSDSGDRGALFAGAVSPMTQASASSMHQGDAAADFSIAAEDEKKIPSFREIMFLQTPAERIAKYNEARDAFGQMESGLNNWILTMKQELPEHAHTTASYSGDTLPPNPAATGGLDGAGQQSYYQQGPNAQGGSARSRLPGFPMQAHGHAGGQIGTKGKEFMQSAGKMGKGLFSKGRNKLRGDKDADRSAADKAKPTKPSQPQQSPPPPQLLDKSSRRKSWALSLGDKLRTTSSGGDSRRHSIEPSTLLTQPQHPHHDKGNGRRDNDNDDDDDDVSSQDTKRDLGPRESWQSNVSEISTMNYQQSYGGEPMQHQAGEWTRPLLSTNRDEDAVPRPGAGVAQQGQGAPQATMAQQVRQSVVTSTTSHPHPPHRLHFSPHGVRTLTTETTPATMDTTAAIAAPASTMSQQQQQEPQRMSSFRGLPPIQRSTSFGLPKFDSLAEDLGGNATRQTGPSPTSINSHSPLQPTAEEYAPSLPPRPNVPNSGSDSHYRDAEQQRQLQRGPWLQNQHDGTPGTPLDASPRQIAQPPSGWRLEESHLAEPLHQARRRTSATNSPVSPPLGGYYNYDKETGFPMPPSPAVASAPPPQPAPPSNGLAAAPTAVDDTQERRKMSGIFKGLGDRIKPSSGDRRSSNTDIPAAAPASPPSSGHAKKGSIFSAASNKAASLQQRFTPGAAPPAPWLEEGERPGSAQRPGSAKRRLSGFTDKATGWAGRFGGGHQKPEAMQTSAPRETSNSLDLEAPPPIAAADGEARGRGRRSSLSGIVSSFTRDRSLSRARQEDNANLKGVTTPVSPPVILDPAPRPSPLRQQQQQQPQQPQQHPLATSHEASNKDTSTWEASRDAPSNANLMPNPDLARAGSVSPSPTFEAERADQTQVPTGDSDGAAPSPVLSRMTSNVSPQFKESASPSNVDSSINSSPRQTPAQPTPPPAVLVPGVYPQQQVPHPGGNSNVAQPTAQPQRLEWQGDRNAWSQPASAPAPQHPVQHPHAQHQPIQHPQQPVPHPYQQRPGFAAPHPSQMPPGAMGQIPPAQFQQHRQPGPYPVPQAGNPYYQGQGPAALQQQQQGYAPAAPRNQPQQGNAASDTSRLKGWRNRLSSQLSSGIKADKPVDAQSASSVSSNTPKNRFSSDKLLGALKRTSKQPDDSSARSISVESTPALPPRPAPQQPMQQQPMYPQWPAAGYQDPRHQGPVGAPPGQYRPPQQFYGPPGAPGPYLQWQGVPPPNWTGQAAQQYHHQQQQPSPNRQPQWQPYYPQQPHQQPYQQPHLQNQQQAQQQVQPQPRPQPLHEPQLAQQQPFGVQQSPPAAQKQPRLPPVQQQPPGFVQNQQEPPQGRGVTSNDSTALDRQGAEPARKEESEQNFVPSSATNVDGQSLSVEGDSSSDQQSSNPSAQTSVPAPFKNDEVPGETSVQNGEATKAHDEGNHGKFKGPSTSISVPGGSPGSDDLYDATPRLPKREPVKPQSAVASTSDAETSPKAASSSSAHTPTPPPTSSAPSSSVQKSDSEAHHAELEDTAEARMRTLRLNGQEEKIFYDADADKPKMSATSYPGQEWNPYGDAEFAYWQGD